MSTNISTATTAVVIIIAFMFSLVVQARESDREACTSRLTTLETRALEARDQASRAWWRACALQNEAAWKEFQAASEVTQAAFATWAQEARAQENWAEEARISEVFWSA